MLIQTTTKNSNLVAERGNNTATAAVETAVTTAAAVIRRQKRKRSTNANPMCPPWLVLTCVKMIYAKCIHEAARLVTACQLSIRAASFLKIRFMAEEGRLTNIRWGTEGCMDGNSHHHQSLGMVGLCQGGCLIMIHSFFIREISTYFWTWLVFNKCTFGFHQLLNK